MLAGLLGAVGTTSLDDLPDVVARHARSAGFTGVHIYVGDLERRAVHLLPGPHVPATVERAVRIQGTVPGRAYQHGALTHDPLPHPDGVRYWVPLSNGLERVGLMSVTHQEHTEAVRENAELLAVLVALAVVSKRGHSDTYARLNRTEPMNTAAEAQWQLLPPRSYRDSRVALAATLEPAYQISGDAYDYAIAGPLVHLSIFDAMGHDTSAGQIAALAVAACRSARRRGAGLVETGWCIERELVGQFGGARYATAVLASLDTCTGVLTWENFGHHPVLVLRGDQGIRLRCPPALPLGTGLGSGEVRTCQMRLRPGDRIVLYTDGIIEARRPHGGEYGLDRLADALTRHHADGLSVPETVRRFVHSFLAHHDGNLEDDATVLLAEWPGPPA